MRARWLLLLTGVYSLALALIGLWRSPIDRNIPVTKLAPVVWTADLFHLSFAQSYHLTEASANVVLFIPLGALVLLWRPEWHWWQATLVALATTIVIETLQQVLRPERFASLNDVFTNTLGGLIGALLVTVARRLRR